MATSVAIPALICRILIISMHIRSIFMAICRCQCDESYAIIGSATAAIACIRYISKKMADPRAATPHSNSTLALYSINLNGIYTFAIDQFACFLIDLMRSKKCVEKNTRTKEWTTTIRREEIVNVLSESPVNKVIKWVIWMQDNRPISVLIAKLAQTTIHIHICVVC